MFGLWLKDAIVSTKPSNVIVTDYSCRTCGGESIEAYHQSFPELRVRGSSADEAARRLAVRLESSLSTVADSGHREPALQALADVLALVDRQGDKHPARDLKAH
jgi:hypothetical protein